VKTRTHEKIKERPMANSAAHMEFQTQSKTQQYLHDKSVSTYILSLLGKYSVVGERKGLYLDNIDNHGIST